MRKLFPYGYQESTPAMAKVLSTKKRKLSYLNLLKPKACPVALIRIGGNSDGAYLIPNDLEEVEACFSPGVCTAKSFEDELAKQFGIRSHLCDFSSSIDALETQLIEGVQTFQKLWLDLKSTPSSINLDDWTNQYEPGGQDLILQIDIEGAEIRNLLHTSQNCLNRFRIIVIELHSLEVLEQKDGWKWRIKFMMAMAWCYSLRPAISPLLKYPWARHLANLCAHKLEPYLVERLLQKLNTNHSCVHAHANNNSHYVFTDVTSGMNIPSLIELTFLRNDRLEGDAKSYHKPQIPHPLDIEVNAPENNKMSLNQYWL